MQRIGDHLSKLSELARLMRDGEHIEQFAAICRRKGENGPEILLITTRETRRWSLPKGWDIKGLKPHQVACREAWEEAGVVGKARKKPFGRFTYVKTLKSGRKVASFVQVHVVEVERMDDAFPEQGQRELAWFSPLEASALVDEPELKGMLASLDARVASAA